jgi:hypothetical protein
MIRRCRICCPASNTWSKKKKRKEKKKETIPKYLRQNTAMGNKTDIAIAPMTECAILKTQRKRF